MRSQVASALLRTCALSKPSKETLGMRTSFFSSSRYSAWWDAWWARAFSIALSSTGAGVVMGADPRSPRAAALPLDDVESLHQRRRSDSGGRGSPADQGAA